jgi:hypothetical protein
MFKAFQSIEGKNNIFIDDDHGCKATAMTSQELLKHLKNEGDSTHTAIFAYLQKLNTFSRGHVRQDPGVNYQIQMKRKRRRRRGRGGGGGSCCIRQQ